MAEVGRKVPNTIGKAPITFAMIELAESADCNARKSGWLSYGFKDVTPLFGRRSSVPTLNGSAVAQGRDMLKAMASVNADWYMVSGHHGALYGSDYDLLGPEGGASAAAAIYNQEQYCGFFNEGYHEGRWMHASRADPDSQTHPPAGIANLHAHEIYLRTALTAPDSIAKHPQVNPLFDRSSGPVQPKGIILSACNTLAYLNVRVSWASYFPGAVIIGSWDRIVSGTWITNAVAAAKMTNESFWRDPQSILDQPGMPMELLKQLTANYPKIGKIGVLYKGNLYVNAKMRPVSLPLVPGVH